MDRGFDFPGIGLSGKTAHGNCPQASGHWKQLPIPVVASQSVPGSEIGLQGVLAVAFKHHFNSFFGYIDALEEEQIFRTDVLMLFVQHLVDPIHQGRPDSFVYQYDGETGFFIGLNEGKDFEQFIHRTETARQHHKTLGILHEYHLAHEEIVELQGLVAVLIGIGGLLEGQVDIESD